jgi:hypothetical protein
MPSNRLPDRSGISATGKLATTSLELALFGLDLAALFCGFCIVSSRRCEQTRMSLLVAQKRHTNTQSTLKQRYRDTQTQNLHSSSDTREVMRKNRLPSSIFSCSCRRIRPTRPCTTSSISLSRSMIPSLLALVRLRARLTGKNLKSFAFS